MECKFSKSFSLWRVKKNKEMSIFTAGWIGKLKKPYNNYVGCKITSQVLNKQENDTDINFLWFRFTFWHAQNCFL